MTARAVLVEGAHSAAAVVALSCLCPPVAVACVPAAVARGIMYGLPRVPRLAVAAGVAAALAGVAARVGLEGAGWAADAAGEVAEWAADVASGVRVALRYTLG